MSFDLSKIKFSPYMLVLRWISDISDLTQFMVIAAGSRVQGISLGSAHQQAFSPIIDQQPGPAVAINYYGNEVFFPQIAKKKISRLSLDSHRIDDVFTASNITGGLL